MKHQEFKTREDKRGELIELFKGKFAQCNLLLMKKDSVWGKHYHKKTREFFYLIEGEILLELLNWNQKKISKRIYKQGGSFTITPKTIHTIQVLENTKCIVLYSKKFSVDDPDIHYK